MSVSWSPPIVKTGPLQRLYSTFANAWPGRGLLLLRIAIATFLIAHCLACWTRPGSEFWAAAVAAGCGLLLLAGLWTPIAGVLTALLQLYLATRPGAAPVSHLLAVAIALGVSLLGPGAWSVDARLFGRRRIPMSDR